MEASQFSPSGSQKINSGNKDQTVPTSTADSPQVVSDSSSLLAAGAATTRRRLLAETSLTENVSIIHSGSQPSIQSWRQPLDSDTEDEITQELVGREWKAQERDPHRPKTSITSSKEFLELSSQSSSAEEKLEPVVFLDDFSKLTLKPAVPEVRLRPRARLRGESEQSTFGESEAFVFSRLLSQPEQFTSTSTAKISDISGTSGSGLTACFEQQQEMAAWPIITDDELQNVRVEPELISPLMSESSTAHEFLEVEEPKFHSLPTYHDDNYPRQPFFAGKSIQSEEKQQVEGKKKHKGTAVIAQPLLRSSSFQVQRSISTDDSNTAGGSSQTKGKRKRQADYPESSEECHSLPLDFSPAVFSSSARMPKRVRSSDETLPFEGKEKSYDQPERP